jgi:hypoxanthine phosphoribosyltransferase
MVAEALCCLVGSPIPVPSSLPRIVSTVSDATSESGPAREILTWETFGAASRELAEQVVGSGFLPDIVIAVARGGLLPGGAVAYALGTKGIGTLNVEFYTDVGKTLDDPRVLPPLMDTSELPGSRVLVVDDVADSGRTLAMVMDLLAEKGVEARSAVLYTKPHSIVTPDYSWKVTDRWITFPWSALPPVEGGHAAARE